MNFILSIVQSQFLTHQKLDLVQMIKRKGLIVRNESSVATPTGHHHGKAKPDGKMSRA